MSLEVLSSLGLPGWVIIAASLIFIFKQVGLLDFFLRRVNLNSEFEQAQIEAKNAAEQSELMALWSQMTQLQSKSLAQSEFLLDHIVDESSTWHKEHSNQLAKITTRQQEISHEMRQLATKFSLLANLNEVELLK